MNTVFNYNKLITNSPYVLFNISNGNDSAFPSLEEAQERLLTILCPNCKRKINIFREWIESGEPEIKDRKEDDCRHKDYQPNCFNDWMIVENSDYYNLTLEELVSKYKVG